VRSEGWIWTDLWGTADIVRDMVEDLPGFSP